MKKWPILYDLSSTGKVKQWEILVDTLYSEVAIVVKHGYVDGKISTTKKVIDKGKNIGKVNETTPYQQAISNAQSKYDKQLKKGYVDNIKDIGKGFKYLPMLAKTYYQSTHPDVIKGKKTATQLSSPLVIQRKLNGVRSPVVKKNGKVKLYTREGNEYTEVCSHLANNLNKLMKEGNIWDGEIYVHGWSFQRIIRAVKKNRIESYEDDIKKAMGRRKVTDKERKDELDMIERCKHDTQKLQYHRYDICDETLTMMDRKWQMARLPVNKYVHQVETLVVNQNELKHWHDTYVKEGYEGLIIRMPDATYRFKYRGKNLWKYKEFIDEEFTIVGYWHGSGTDEGTIKFKCKSNNPKANASPYFYVRPRGSVESRRLMYKEGYKYIGKLYTVRYQELSEEGNPIFPVGIAVRDYE
jgi:DNA ligase-1